MKVRLSKVPSWLVIGALVGSATSGCTGDDGQGAGTIHLHRVERAPVLPPHSASRPQGVVIDPPSPHVAATHNVAANLRSHSAPAGSLSVDGRLLVISADGTEAALPAIRAALDYLGTPYTVRVASTAGPLSSDQLSAGLRGRYQGVILTTGSLAYYDGSTWRSALSDADWHTLWSYESTFGVRQVTWYTYPTPDFGFNWGTAVDTSAEPISLTPTAAGRELFPYVPRGVTVRDAYAYLATPADAAATPLLTDSQGHALALVERYTDGRENLALTFDSSPHLLHTLVLSYGLVDWVTRGVFIGERHAYITAHVDDVFYGNDLYLGGEYRMTGDDLGAVVSWQRALRQQPTTAALRLDMVFNGEGSLAGMYDPDTLTPAARMFQADFKWINHTYQHLNLDAVSRSTAREQIRENTRVAERLRLGDYNRASLVTGQVSGLRNPEAMRAAKDEGVRYVVSDTSRAGEDNPSPNAGIYNWLQPSILMIPRRPTNLFYNVSTPIEWAAEYNAFYRSYWGRDLSYDEILDRESDVLLRYLLRGEIDPWMFHQSNLRAYDGAHTLLGDLLDRVLERYRELVDLPVLSPTMDDVGRRVQARMRFNASGVTASIVHGYTITLTAARRAVVPVTGLSSDSAERYGTETISYIELGAGQTITLPLR